MKMIIFGPKTAKRKLMPSEQLDNIFTWRYRMFDNGHKMSEIDTLSYWDLIEYSHYVEDSRPKQPGEVRFKQPKLSQLKMIEERKAEQAKLKNKK